MNIYLVIDQTYSGSFTSRLRDVFLDFQELKRSAENGDLVSFCSDFTVFRISVGADGIHKAERIGHADEVLKYEAKDPKYIEVETCMHCPYNTVHRSGLGTRMCGKYGLMVIPRQYLASFPDWCPLLPRHIAAEAISRCTSCKGLGFTESQKPPFQVDCEVCKGKGYIHRKQNAS